MAHVILGHCCKDASCVKVCPQNCIQPRPGTPEFDTVEHLYIDPASCIDCSACVEACPAGAIKPENLLTDSERRYAELSAESFVDILAVPAVRPSRPVLPRAFAWSRKTPRIAIVGGGTAAMYTVRELLQRSSTVRITVFERYAEIGGLLRTVVSQDHHGVQSMRRLFDIPFGDSRVDLRRNVSVGDRVSVTELRQRYDVVVLAHGASSPRAIEPPPPASHQAVDVLTAANEAAARGVSARLMQGREVAVVGGGNVALDVVTNMVRRRIETCAGEPITRVHVITRSTPELPSLTASALHELVELGAVLEVDSYGGVVPNPLRRLLPARAFGEPTAGQVRVTISFGNEVTAWRPAGAGVQMVTADDRVFTADAVVCAMGFTSAVLEGVPMRDNGVVSNGGGRVVCPDSGTPVPGLYVVGWAKRGAKGGLGDNRRCAEETVDKIVEDMAAAVSGH